MIIKDVITPYDKQRVVGFLAEQGLKFEQNSDKTIYIEDADKIVGTVSAARYIIKCLAVSSYLRGENLAVTLVGEMIKRLHADGIYYYQVFTKSEYKDVFESLGFKTLVKTEKTVMLEGGDGNINDVLNGIKVQMRFNLNIPDVGNPAHDVACIVLNGDPFTLGHLALAEYALKNHKYLVVFVLEEEGSYFSANERYTLAYLALRQFPNALVVKSTRYIVSQSTFPQYFLKTADEATGQYAEFDAKIFAEYFMPALGLTKRYIGSETTDYMSIYNATLKSVLGDKVEEVPRFSENGMIISAKTVRALLKEGDVNGATQLVPIATRALFANMAKQKQN